MSMSASGLKYDDDQMPYITLGDIVVRLENNELSDKHKEKARLELRETPEIVGPALEELRQLLKTETALHVPTDDEFLTMFLRPCKFYPQSAFERIKKYFKLKVKYNKVFDDILPSNVRHVFEQELIRLLPQRTEDGRRLLIIECGRKWKPSKCSLPDLFRAIQVAIVGSMREPTTQVCGGMVLFDFDGLSLSHVMQFTPSFAAMLLEWVQETLSLRLKAVHIFNNSYVFNMLFAVFKPFIQEKLRKRIFFHGKDTKSLAAHIDPVYLPARYGGTKNVPDINGSDLADLFQHFHKEYEMSNTFGYNTN